MATFRWIAEQEGMEELFVGVAPLAVATIFHSNKGKRWRSHIELPCQSRLWKRWLPYETVKAMTEKEVGDWLAFATMDMPAQDTSPE